MPPPDETSGESRPTVTIHVAAEANNGMGVVAPPSNKAQIEMSPMVLKPADVTSSGTGGINMALDSHGQMGESPASAMYPHGAQFPLSIANFQRLFNTETTPAEVNTTINEEWGGVSGLMQKLDTSPTGLDADMCAAQSQSIAERINMYGQNVLPVAAQKTFFDFCKEVLEDTMLRVLMAAGVLSIVLGMISEGASHGWYEGAAIIIAVILVTVVSAGNNYQQQKQFAAIDISKELDPVTVIRSGRQFSVDPTEVLVGDLVAMAAGQRIPADGVLIQLKGRGLKVNESSATGETGLVEKKLSAPLMMSGTEVVSGSCVMLVVLVGINTSYGQTLASLVEEDRQTPLQHKLEAVAKLIGMLGTVFAAATFIALFGYWLHHVLPGAPSSSEWSGLLDIAVVCISIIVVAVPEGLPLAVTVSLAYSMKAMLKDHILVRELSACETMGNATAICSDKTGTLTQNRMTVSRVFLQQQMLERPPAREEITATTMTLLEHGIIMNSSAWIEDEHMMATVNPADWAWKDGNQTEVALLAWMISYGFDVNKTRAKYEAQKRVSEPFDSIKKYSSIIMERTDAEIAEDAFSGGSKKRYRQFFKGAAEAIIAQSDRQTNKDGVPIALTASGGNLHRDLLETVSEFSRRGLRVIAFAYRDLDELPKKSSDKVSAAVGSSDEQKEGTDTEPGAADDDAPPPITDAVLIGMVGLSDPLRPTSYRSVRLCQRAGIIVRMVTGDHVETARFISRECGIWTSKNHLCLTGAEFRRMMAEEDEETKILKVSRLRVLARSSPQDKQVLVKFLQKQGEVVAATGDGTNDAPALKSADVGIAMFLSGTSVCKSAADLWLLDDNFASIVAAVVWGRCVFDNIRKFLQFQLTVNFVALVISLVGAITDYPLPLTTVQLLWINLIMDTAAAVALGTEQPVPEELLARTPLKPDVPLVSIPMWYKILSQGCYQLAVLFFLLYSPHSLFPSVVSNSTDHKTLIFNCFVWLQIGNSFNARRVPPTLNSFAKILDNWYFLAIMVGAMCMQVLMVEAFGSFANTTHQTGEQWLCALVVGAFIWVTNVAFYFLWRALLKVFPKWSVEVGARAETDAFEGAHLDDKLYSFKRPDDANEMSMLRNRVHSRLSFSHHAGGEGGPVERQLNAADNAPAVRVLSSMSARRATGSARRTNPLTFHAVSGEPHAAQGELEAAAAAPTAAGPSREQLAASASWPRAPIDSEGSASNKIFGSHQKPQHGGVQVIEELDELL